MPSNKERLDQILVNRGLAETKSKAQGIIMAGLVFSGERKLEKSGVKFDVNINLEVRGKEHPYVSRGGLKLAHALDCFDIKPIDFVCIDVGASTGGFTDVLLKNGAAKVYAVDVGYGQLANSLRQDDKVVVIERTNARYLTLEHIPEKVDMVVCDASFISLKTILPTSLSMVKNGGFLVALIKPQFEAGRENIGKKGVVRDEAVHAMVCADIKQWLSTLIDWQVIDIVESPITGPEGNKEFLIYAEKPNRC